MQEDKDRRSGFAAEHHGYIEVLNKGFEHIGGWSYDHRWIVLAACALIVALYLLLASNVRYDNSFEAYFDRADPMYAAYLQFREDFGSDEVSYIMYEAPDAPHGPWNLEVMRKIGDLTKALEEEVPFVLEVTSLTNVEFLDPVPGGIRVYKLLEEFPETQEDLLAIKNKVLAKPMYVGGLASADGKYAAILVEMEKSSVDPLEEIKLDPQGGNGLDNFYPQATNNKIREILARPEYSGIRFHHTGDVPLNSEINVITATEGPILGTISAVVISALLFFFFRSATGILGPLAVVTLGILASVALVAMLGWELDLTFGMLPTLLVAIGVEDAVHIISEFRRYHAELGDRRAAVRRTLYLVGTPCLLTSATTAAGFASMAAAPIKSLANFAVYSAFGVMAAFGFSVTLLVVFLSFGKRAVERGAGEREKVRAKGGRWFLRSLTAVAEFNVCYRKAILVVTAGIVIVSLLGMHKTRVDSNFLNDFSEKVPVRRATLLVDEVMSGSNSFVYLFDSGAPDGIKDPEVLREIARVQAEADKQTDIVTKTYSVVDLLKDINQTFHDGDPAYYRLPETRELVAQYLLLYEMSGGEEIEEYVSDDYARASLELRCRWSPSSVIAQMAENLDSYLQQHPLQLSKAAVTGIGALWVQLIDYITRSQIQGFGIAFVTIAVMMCLLFQSVKLGLLAMVPNLVPVVVTLGFMGWFDIPLDYVRLLIAPVAIGIAVDYTIHLTTRYRHEFLLCGDYREALHGAMRDVGRAMFIASAALVGGFLVLMLSVMDSQATFGVLLAGTIVLALIANFLLMPALIMTFEPFGAARERRDRKEQGRG